MLLSQPRAQKICLEDYDYKRDISNRLLLAGLKARELEIFEEILNSTPTFSVEALVSNCDREWQEVQELLNKLEPTGLLQVKDELVTVNKEMRKYFEGQALKFEEGFRPGIEYLCTLLKKVPISVLPNWYAIPRTADNIYIAIFEKYLAHPKSYEQYLNELELDSELLRKICHEIHQDPERVHTAKEICERHDLSSEAFQEVMLLLEFHLVAFVSFRPSAQGWTEVVTPFNEWVQYSRERRLNSVPYLSETTGVEIRDPDPFAFINLCGQYLQELVDGGKAHPEEPCHRCLVHAHLLLDEEGTVCIAEEAHSWLKASPAERSARLARSYKIAVRRHIEAEFGKPSEKEILDLVRCVGHLKPQQWVLFEDFIRSIEIPIGDCQETHLERKGRSWRYVRPHYSSKEMTIFRWLILECLWELGYTQVGHLGDKECFCVTDFGASTMV